MVKILTKRVFELVSTNIPNHSPIIMVISVLPQDGETTVIITRGKKGLQLIYQGANSIAVA
jgi:hypothetical protein